MAADLSALTPAFRGPLARLLSACAARGIEMRPYCAIRTPQEQGKLWRQSRTREEIERKIGDLIALRAPFLAHCIESAGPQNGPRVTDAAPGFSWHQWGESVDCFWVVDGRAEWSSENWARNDPARRNGYRVYAQEAGFLGLTSGGRWKSPDWPHVQLRADASPLEVYGIEEIESAMRKRFGTP